MAKNRTSRDKKKVKEEDGILMFEDEAVFQISGTTIRSWALKGKGTLVESFPGRKSMKVFGAISAEENPRFHFLFAPVFNAETFLRFLKRIVRQNPVHRVHMVLDNVRYHHACKIQRWLNENEKKIELHFLPPYSPQFNPIEKAWKATKKASIHNRFFENTDDLHEALFRRFNRFQGNPASIRNLVKTYVH